MDEPIFSKIPIATDARITPVLDTCLHCRAALNPTRTSTDSGTMMLFAQCPKCLRVYVLDAMTLP